MHSEGCTQLCLSEEGEQKEIQKSGVCKEDSCFQHKSQTHNKKIKIHLGWWAFQA